MTIHSEKTQIVPKPVMQYLAFSYAEHFNAAALFPDDPTLYEHIYSAIGYNRGITDQSQLVSKIEIYKIDQEQKTLTLINTITLV